MGAPKVIVNQTNGNLGRFIVGEDGITLLLLTGVAVMGKFALNDVLGPFTSINDAEALGIDKDYDIDNTCLAWRHIHDFYSESGNGVKLYVMVVAATTLMSAMTDNTNVTNGAKKALVALAGKVRLLGISRVSDEDYVPAYTTQIEDDIILCITNAKTLVAAEFAAYRPLQVMIEGRDWQGNVGSTLDLRDATASPNANRVSLVIGQDIDVANDADNPQPNYACIGKLLGRAARIQVHQNVGRVKDEGLTEMIVGGLSNNAKTTTLTDAQIDALNDKGYIFVKTHPGITGFYFNDDHTACPLTDDYAFINLGRPADKATRIARVVYVRELLDNIQVNPDSGKMAASSCKHFESLVEDAIDNQMVSQGELAGVDAFCDANQNVITSNQVALELAIVPLGTARKILVNQGYALSI